MLTLNLSESEQNTLNVERFNYPCPIVQKRMHTIYLKAKNYSHTYIADILDIHINSVTNFIKIYQQGGIAQLKQVNYGTNKSQLDDFKTSIEDDFRKKPPMSTNEAVQRIENLTGIKLSPTRVRVFMKRIGMKRHKLGHIPAKADPEKQSQWLQDTLEPHIEAARNGKCQLLFMDAAHFVLKSYLCYVWSFARLFVKAPAGRKRLNVLGAVNAITKEVDFLSNTSYINAEVIADFLRQLALKYWNYPIVIVLDNARYQHCIFIKDIANKLGITLLFLPSYSPNLNIIERLWKFIKKKALYAQYYEKFEAFQEAIIETIHKINKDQKYKEEVQSLLTLKFQTFENSQIYEV
jgi:transposase